MLTGIDVCSQSLVRGREKQNMKDRLFCLRGDLAGFDVTVELLAEGSVRLSDVELVLETGVLTVFNMLAMEGLMEGASLDRVHL